MIAFLLPNEGSDKPLIAFATTVDVVEAVTGLDFFSLVPKTEQERLESTISIEAWAWKEQFHALLVLNCFYHKSYFLVSPKVTTIADKLRSSKRFSDLFSACEAAN